MKVMFFLILGKVTPPVSVSDQGTLPRTGNDERFAGNTVAFRTSLGRLLVVHNVYPSLSDVASKCRVFPGGPKIRPGAPSFEFAAMGSVPSPVQISNLQFQIPSLHFSLFPAS